MKKLEKLLLIFLLTLPILLASGVSAWVIINVQENNEDPFYNYETIVENAFKEQEKIFNGLVQGPDPMYKGEINSEIIDYDSFTFEHILESDKDTNKWISGFPTDSGKYIIRITNKYAPNATPIEVTFEIIKAKQIVTGSDLVVTYDGKAHKIDESTIKVEFGNKEDGALTISNNIDRINVGTYEVLVKVEGDKNFDPYENILRVIINAKDIAEKDVEALVTTEYVYKSQTHEHKPSYADMKITYNGMTLDQDDYEIIGYANNINATKENSKATVTIQGKGNYTGTRVIEFEIEKATQNPIFETSKIYDAEPVSISVTRDLEVPNLPVIKFFDKDYNEIIVLS